MNTAQAGNLLENVGAYNRRRFFRKHLYRFFHAGEFIGVISIDSRYQEAQQRIDTDKILLVATIIVSVIHTPSQ